MATLKREMIKILIISTTGMGDTLWGTPAIRAVKKKFPQIDIDLLLQPQWQGLFTESPYIRKLIPYHSQWYRQLLGLPNLLQDRYEHVLIFHANKNISRILLNFCFLSNNCQNFWYIFIFNNSYFFYAEVLAVKLFY